MSKQINKRQFKKKYRPSDIMIKLWQAGYGLKDFAEAVGCSVPYVSLVIAGKRKSLKLQKLVAKRLDMPVDKLFPPKKERAA